MWVLFPYPDLLEGFPIHRPNHLKMECLQFLQLLKCRKTSNHSERKQIEDCFIPFFILNSTSQGFTGIPPPIPKTRIKAWQKNWCENLNPGKRTNALNVNALLDPHLDKIPAITHFDHCILRRISSAFPSLLHTWGRQQWRHQEMHEHARYHPRIANSETYWRYILHIQNMCGAVASVEFGASGMFLWDLASLQLHPSRSCLVETSPGSGPKRVGLSNYQHGIRQPEAQTDLHNCTDVY